MWEADDEMGDDDEDDDDVMVVDMSMTPDLQCVMRLSDGSTHEADKYVPGENGCAIAAWTKFKDAYQTEIVNEWIHENRLLKPAVKRKAPADEEDEVEETGAEVPHAICGADGWRR